MNELSQDRQCMCVEMDTCAVTGAACKFHCIHSTFCMCCNQQRNAYKSRVQRSFSMSSILSQLNWYSAPQSPLLL